MTNYAKENDRLLAQYDKLVGEALALGIKVYRAGSGRPGYLTRDNKYVAADLGPWPKAMGDLQDEIRAAQALPTRDFTSYLAEAFASSADRN